MVLWLANNHASILDWIHAFPHLSFVPPTFVVLTSIILTAHALFNPWNSRHAPLLSHYYKLWQRLAYLKLVYAFYEYLPKGIQICKGIFYWVVVRHQRGHWDSHKIISWFFRPGEGRLNFDSSVSKTAIDEHIVPMVWSRLPSGSAFNSKIVKYRVVFI